MSNEPDEVNSGAIATVLGLVALFTLGVALVVTALVRDETGELQASKDLSQEHAYRQLKAQQLTSLSGAPAWTDKTKSEAKVPIYTAMKIVVDAVRANPKALTPLPPKKEEEPETPEIGAGETEGAEQESPDKSGDGPSVDKPSATGKTTLPGKPEAPQKAQDPQKAQQPGKTTAPHTSGTKKN